MTTTLETVLQSVTELEADAAERYEQLAREIVAGESPEATDVAEILRAADKTKENLRSFVHLLQNRDRLRAQIEESNRLHQRNTELRRLVERENAKLEQAVAEHQVATRPLQVELASNQQFQQTVSGNSQELFQTCPCTTLKSRLSNIQHYQQMNNNKQREAGDNLHRATTANDSHNYRASPEEGARIDAWVKRAQQTLVDLEKEAADLVRQNDAAVQAMRDW